MSGLEDRLLTLIKDLEEEKRLADKRAKQLFDLTKALQTTAKARAWRNGNQTNIPVTTWIQVQLNAESYDLGNNFNVGTYEFTAPVSGYYLIYGALRWLSPVGDRRYMVGIRIAGVIKTSVMNQCASSGLDLSSHLADILYVAATETIRFYCWHDSGAVKNILGDETATYFAIHLISV